MIPGSHERSRLLLDRAAAVIPGGINTDESLRAAQEALRPRFA